jgi:hypothetical protein
MSKGVNRRNLGQQEKVQVVRQKKTSGDAGCLQGSKEKVMFLTKTSFSLRTGASSVRVTVRKWLLLGETPSGILEIKTRVLETCLTA